MLTGDKNLKDTKSDTSISTKDTHILMSYTKTQKLITALYIVTDIIDKEEPIRNKLRTLGVEILSDLPAQAGMSTVQSGTPSMSKTVFDIAKIDQVLSFLNIASTMNFISEMNHSILQKEFIKLKESIQEHTEVKPTWLEEFLLTVPSEDIKLGASISNGHINSKGHVRIGVQKGGTLLGAIKDMSNRMPAPYEAEGFRSGSDIKFNRSEKESFSLLKKERRYNIIKIIKDNGGSATIKDIKEKLNVGNESSLISSEKTLQRELMSMIKDDVLNKTGEKRWTQYSLSAS